MPSPADPPRAGRATAWVVGGALLAFLLPMVLRPEYGIDIFWHIKAGEWMVRHGAFPDTDIFSYAHPERTWVPFQWLYEVGAWALHEGIGFRGLRLLNALLVLAGFGLAWRAAWRALDGRWWLALLVVAALAALYHDRIRIRPHVLNLLFEFALLPLLLDAFRRARAWQLAGVVVIAALWANLHAGAATLLPVMIGAVLAGGLSERLFQGATDTPLRRVAWVLGAGALVMVLSPNYLAGNLTAFTMYEATRLIIPEWKPTFSYLDLGSAPHFVICGSLPYLLALPVATQGVARALDLPPRRAWIPLAGLLILGALALMANEAPVALAPPLVWLARLGAAAGLLYVAMHARRAGTLGELLLAAGLLYVSHSSARFVYLAVIPLIIWLRWNLPLLRAHAPSLGLLCTLASLGLLASTAHYYYGLQRQGVGDALRMMRYDLEPTRFPLQASDAIEELGLEGRIFNQTEWGGYLLFRHFPPSTVFSDGRGNLDDEELVAVIESHKAAHREHALEVTTQRFGMDLLVFRAPAFPRGSWDHTRWARAYHDPDADVFVRVDQAPAQWQRAVQGWSARGVRPPREGDAGDLRRFERDVARRTFATWAAQPYQARRLAALQAQVASADPLERARGHVGLARLFARADLPDQAEAHAAALLKESPFHPRALLWLGKARRLQGRGVEAMGPAQLALTVDAMPPAALLGGWFRLKAAERALARDLLRWAQEEGR